MYIVQLKQDTALTREHLYKIKRHIRDCRAHEAWTEQTEFLLTEAEQWWKQRFTEHVRLQQQPQEPQPPPAETQALAKRTDQLSMDMDILGRDFNEMKKRIGQQFNHQELKDIGDHIAHCTMAVTDPRQRGYVDRTRELWERRVSEKFEHDRLNNTVTANDRRFLRAGHITWGDGEEDEQC